MARDIFDYLDYREFLAAWFKEENELRRKEGRIPLTHRAFHERAGVSNMGTLIQVLEFDRRLTPGLANHFIKPLEIEPESLEHRYLLGLIELEAAESQVKKTAIRLADMTRKAAEARERRPPPGNRDRVRLPNAVEAARLAHEGACRDLEAVKARLRALRSQARASPIEGEVKAILGSLLTSAVLELARSPEFVAEPGWIQARLRLPATEPEVEKALDALRRAQVLTEQGVLAPVFRTRERVPAQTVADYYPAVSRAASCAMDEMFGPDRLEAQARQRLGALTVAIPSGSVADFDRLMLHLQEEVAQFLSALEGDRDVVYQIYLHLFPLSKTPGVGP